MKILEYRNHRDGHSLGLLGELLVVGRQELSTTIQSRKGDHFFVGLESGNDCLYGWVSIRPDLTVDMIISEAINSPSHKRIGKSPSEIGENVKFTVDSICKLKENTPVVCDFVTKSFRDKTKTLKIHKVFFSLGNRS